jgi:hypothetical protein
MFDEQRLGNHGTSTAWTAQAEQGDDQVGKQDEDLAHGRQTLRTTSASARTGTVIKAGAECRVRWATLCGDMLWRSDKLHDRPSADRLSAT